MSTLFYRISNPFCSLLPQPSEEAVEHGLAVLLVDCLRQRNGHGAGTDAVLRVAAICDAVLAHDGREALVARHLARRVHVHQTHLRDGLRADVVAFAVLRAGFQTAAARHASLLWIALPHFFLLHPRPGAVLV